MPIYDYECRQCRHELELVVLDTRDIVCAHCGSTDLKQLLSPTAPPGKSATILQNARKVAAGEGHFSHYARSERPRS